MLKGKEFGAAINAAIQMKIDSGGARSKAEIARHFGVKPPSVEDWINKGSIAKEKLPELWRYFSDVAGPAHWGMSRAEWPLGLSDKTMEMREPEASRYSLTWPFDAVDEEKVRNLDATEHAHFEAAILIVAAQLGLDVKK